MAALLMMVLPETLNAPLPATMQDAEDYDECVKEIKQAKKAKSVIEKTEMQFPPELRKNSNAA